jgi:hypothetical protein
MQTYELEVTDRKIRAVSDDTTLVRTSAYVDEVKVVFASDEWLEFDQVSVAFSNHGIWEEPLYMDGDVGYCTVPPEALENVGPLGITVHASDTNRHIITEKSFPLTVEQEGDHAIGD